MIKITKHEMQIPLKREMSKAQFRTLRNQAFESEDLSFFRRLAIEVGNMTGKKITESNLLASFHKARFECVDINHIKRVNSQLWMIKNNVDRLNGKRVRLIDDLPTGDDGMGCATHG